MSERIPLVEETPTVHTRVVEDATVRVARHQLVRSETIAPHLSSDEVEVERIEVNREVDAPVPVRQDGDTTIVSVHEEIAVVTTRWVVTEEIHVRRKTQARRVPQEVTLRRDVVDVTRAPAPPAPDD